jgi:hypothetical protein
MGAGFDQPPRLLYGVGKREEPCAALSASSSCCEIFIECITIVTQFIPEQSLPKSGYGTQCKIPVAMAIEAPSMMLITRFLQVTTGWTISLMEVLRSLDAFPKLKAEDTVRTTHGACASIVAFILMAYLFSSEFAFYSTIEVSDRLTVNSTHGEHLKVPAN